jgi:glycosyltransferase involved in cell wall biosynthesis
VPTPSLALIVTDAVTARYLLGTQLSFLTESGIDVQLITSPGTHFDVVQRTQKIRSRQVPMRREIRPFADIVSLARLTRLLLRDKPWIVSASTPKAGLLGLIAATIARIPVRIYTVRGLRLESTVGLKRIVLRWSERIASRCAHHIVLVSESLRQEYLELGLAGGRPTYVLGAGSSNGVDCERYRPSRNEQEAKRLAQSVGLEHDAPTIGFVGRLVKDKGIDDLVSAFRDHVLEQIPAAQLLVLGDFESADPISKVAREALHVHPRIGLAGFVEDTSPWYQLMDVLAFPSFREGFPNAPLEAAASGLPVAGYKATGTIDAVVDGRTGTLVEQGDIRALGDAICRYLRDADLRQSHGRAGRQRAAALFEQRKAWERWRDFYLGALESTLQSGSPE